MKRIAPEPEQLPLFDLPTAAAPARPPTSWVARHWPAYAGAERADPPLSFEAWAATDHDLPRAARRLLMTIVQETQRIGACRFSLPALGDAAGLRRSTCRRHLDGLMSRGLVMLKPLMNRAGRGRKAIGYALAPIATEADRAAAARDGYVSARPPGDAAPGPLPREGVVTRKRHRARKTGLRDFTSTLPIRVEDFYASHLTTSQRGVFVDLLSHLWVHGSLPHGTRALARAARVDPRTFARMEPQLALAFDIDEDGRWRHYDLEALRAAKAAKARRRTTRGPITRRADT